MMKFPDFVSGFIFMEKEIVKLLKELTLKLRNKQISLEQFEKEYDLTVAKYDN